MPTVLHVLLALVVLAASGIASADQEASIYAVAVHEKLLRLSRLNAPADETANDLTSEHTILVDIDSNGSVVRVQQGHVADSAAAAKVQRLIFMASPFPRLPTTLAGDYSTIRLAIVYAVASNKNPSFKHTEVKGGCRYVEFKGAL